MLDQDYFDFAEIGVGPDCPKCHTPQDWIPCYSVGCDEGYYDGHEYDDPLWYDPGEMVICEDCQGKGGWWHCYECAKRESEEVNYP